MNFGCIEASVCVSVCVFGGGGLLGWFSFSSLYESGQSSVGQTGTACEERREFTCLLDV